MADTAGKAHAGFIVLVVVYFYPVVQHVTGDHQIQTLLQRGVETQTTTQADTVVIAIAVVQADVAAQEQMLVQCHGNPAVECITVKAVQILKLQAKLGKIVVEIVIPYLAGLGLSHGAGADGSSQRQDEPQGLTLHRSLLRKHYSNDAAHATLWCRFGSV